MHRNQALVVQAVVLLTSLSYGAVPAARKFSGESAVELAAKLTAFGPRPAGSDAHARMEGFIESKLKSFGCKAVADVWTAQTPAGPKRMKNILVKIAGVSGKPVVLTGHYDTKAMPGITFVGANDGGSSAAILLEFARVLCGTKSRNDLWLAWLDGEEAV
ncbi:MAG: M28 family peptidase, partial [Bryobacteraceae bacterium]|nr:M28 family peptidase [Bryobacteraceae bacterium]